MNTCIYDSMQQSPEDATHIKSKFARQCISLEWNQGRSPICYGLFIFQDDAPKGRKWSAFYDDGNLHITNPSGIRACFDVQRSQTLSGWDTNKNSRAVLEALGHPELYTSMVMEDDDVNDNGDERECIGRRNGDIP